MRSIFFIFLSLCFFLPASLHAADNQKTSTPKKSPTRAETSLPGQISPPVKRAPVQNKTSRYMNLHTSAKCKGSKKKGWYCRYQRKTYRCATPRRKCTLMSKSKGIRDHRGTKARTSIGFPKDQKIGLGIRKRGEVRDSRDRHANTSEKTNKVSN